MGRLRTLMGTNAQAAVAKRKLLSDPSPLVVRAGRLYRPGPKWLHRRSVRRARKQAEAQIKQDPAGWRRYENLRQELWAWNAVESGVAAGFAAALAALYAVIVG
jgi:hypothetical protein